MKHEKRRQQKQDIISKVYRHNSPSNMAKLYHRSSTSQTGTFLGYIKKRW